MVETAAVMACSDTNFSKWEAGMGGKDTKMRLALSWVICLKEVCAVVSDYVWQGKRG